MAIKITPTEAALLSSVASDANIANRDGIQVQPSVAYVNPIPDYVTIVPPASDTETAVLNGIKSVFAPFVRYAGPISMQATVLGPQFTISDVTFDLLTLTMPNNLEVPRTVQITANGTCSASANDQLFTYWLEVNATTPPYNHDQTAHFRLYFNTGSVHHSFSGSWIITLPVGQNTVTLRGVRSSGANNITFDTNDFINMTLIG